ncbi:MAG: hypothetical protein J0I41_01780 [Filimonas sp.]|nr:hypothetical protein [Filimonas sp.]
MSRKHLFLLVISISSLISAIAQAKKGYKVYVNWGKEGLCNSTIVLFSDSTYCNESGCEASSRFSFGKWRQVKNNIQFTPSNPRTYNFISKVEKNRSDVDSIKVVICDRDGNNISDKVTLGLYVKDVGLFAMRWKEAEQEWSGIKRSNSVIQLLSFMYLFKQTIEIPMSDSANVYKVYLNFSHWNFRNQSTWSNVNVFSLVKKKSKLVSPYPDVINKRGNLIPREYVFEKEIQ